MSKHEVFDATMSTEFRWPKAGDVAFGASPEWNQNAYPPEELSMRLFAMTEGYRLGAEAMIDRSYGDESNDRDMLVFPIIFSYRQYLELSLKGLIATYGPAVRIRARWDTHRLDVLWKRFQDVLDQYGTVDPDEADQHVAAVVAEFAKIDPDSFSHRYPVDRNGKPLPTSIDALDLAQLKDVMRGASGYFSGCEGYLDALRSAAP